MVLPSQILFAKMERRMLDNPNYAVGYVLECPLARIVCTTIGKADDGGGWVYIFTLAEKLEKRLGNVKDFKITFHPAKCDLHVTCSNGLHKGTGYGTWNGDPEIKRPLCCQFKTSPGEKCKDCDKYESTVRYLYHNIMG